jgi:hypothetical protein
MRKLLVLLAIGALLTVAPVFADDDKEKSEPYQVNAAGVSQTLFPVGHPFHDPATADLLRDDCSAIGWATLRGRGGGRASYIGAFYIEQSHCVQLEPPFTGSPTGFFKDGEGTLTGEGTDKQGERDTITITYQATRVEGVPAGPVPWCNPELGPCPITGNGAVTITGGTGRFSKVIGGGYTAFLVLSADSSAPGGVFGDGEIVARGKLPGKY